jgi:catechol 2,3-dioxygenase-like lactoylglutathione lyase family enzyme
MLSRFRTALLSASLLTGGGAIAQPTAAPVQAAQPVQAAKPHFAMNGMNVYRRFPEDRTAAMVSFYDKALGLKSLQPIQLNASQQMILFGIGGGQIKLAAGLKEGRQYHTGGAVNDAVGIRLFALRFPDEAALVARFKAAGFAAPAFRDMGGGKRGALVQDPAGFWVQLVIDAGATAAGVEVGINVSDIARSRAFYRSFVGLEELPPVEDKLLGVTKYPFRHGETVISLWSAGKGLPADTGSAGIQYVIDNVDAVNARALAQKVTVEEPLGGLPNFSIRFVWLNDPDGVTNYFAQQGVRPSASAKP